MTTSSPRPQIGSSAAWRGTDLVVTSPELIERIDRPYLSVSTSKSMHSCPARLVADRSLPRQFDLFGATEKGSAAHTVLERLYQLSPGRRDPDHAMHILTRLAVEEVDPESGEVDYAKALGTDPVRYARWIGEISKAYSGIFAIEDPTTVDVYATELRLDGIEVAGVPYKGFVDRIDNVDGGLQVVDYKGLALDTPIPTPTGWTTMGDLQVGEQVLGSDGLPTNVTIKSQVHHRPCYRLTFSDGTSVVCDNVHLWQIDDSVRGGVGRKVVSADDLYALFVRRQAEGHTRSLTIPNVKALGLPDAGLPIDPYVLGVWLGDGHGTKGSITVGHLDLPDMLVALKSAWAGEVRVERNGVEAAFAKGGAHTVALTKPSPDACGLGHHGATETYERPDRAPIRLCLECSRERSAARRAGERYRVKGAAERWNVPLRSLLSDAGLLGNKHIPAAYLRASQQQRLALLQGLMDSDGYWNTKRGQAVFVTTLPDLADQVFELVSSLGVTVSRFDTTDQPSRGRFKVAHRLSFRPAGFNPFRLPRKAMLVDDVLRTYSTVRATRRIITAMDPVESVPTQCIQVDAADSLYACGPGFSLCHNTGRDKSKPNPRFSDDHGDQIKIYVDAVREHLGIKAKTGKLYYIEHGKQRRVAVNDRDVKKATKDFAQSWDELGAAIETSTFATKTSPLCGWCPLVNSCPAAQAEGKTDRKGDAPAAVDLGIPTVPERAPEPVVAEVIHAEPVRHTEVGEGDVPADETEELETMTNDKPWREGKPYDGPMIDGHPNLNSYAATAAYGITDLAVEELHKAGVPLTAATVGALAGTLAAVVASAQRRITGRDAMDDGANTRLRGALRTVLVTMPLPFGASDAAWKDWANRSVKRTVAIATVANDLVAGGAPAPSSRPWAALLELEPDPWAAPHDSDYEAAPERIAS